MALLLPADYEYPLPTMYRVRQKFVAPRLAVTDIAQKIREQMRVSQISGLIKPNMRVAVAVGSRGIANLELIVKTVIDELQSLGAAPFIVSAMGSHGGGTEAGQLEVLAGYGITAAAMGVPVVTTVDTEVVGKLTDGRDIYFDRAALQADLIVPINRVKLHTDFIGELQSGLAKMLVIGLGNQRGCSSIHETEPARFAAVLEEAATKIIAAAPVGFGVAIIENAYDETAVIECIPASTLIAAEKRLVKRAIDYMPSLMIPKIDVLVMDEIGKDVSGAGFDPNIVGRSSARDEFLVPIPSIERMVLLGLTAASHGNGIGIGLFDVVLKDIFPELDLDAIYTNAIACRCIEDARIPLMAETAEEALRIAIKMCRRADKNRLRIVRIKNTLSLGEIVVSEALLPVVEESPNLECLGALTGEW